MTDQYYYNCLVPDAMVPKGGTSVEDTPPPRPPRPQRTYDSRIYENIPQQIGDSGHRQQFYQQQGPEVPPRRGAVGPPIHQRAQSEPFDIGLMDLEWSPHRYKDSSHTYSEPRDHFGYSTVRSPARLKDELGQGVPPSEQPQRSPGLHYSTNNLTYENDARRGSRDYLNNSSPRWQDIGMSVVCDNRSPNLTSAETSPGVPPRLSSSNPGSAEPSPGLPKRSPSSSSAEPSPCLPQKSPNRSMLDKTPSFEYPIASPRKHEFHQVS